MLAVTVLLYLFPPFLVEKRSVSAASDLSAFPESYQEPLRIVQELRPNWIFVPVFIPAKWDDVVAAESKLGISLIASSVNDGWKSTAPRAYDWLTNTYVAYDGTSWVNASKETVAYYLDSRNFLHDERIFQFHSLQYDPQVEILEGVERMLRGTFMDGKTIADLNGNQVSYAQAFIDAAATSGASAFHLASRVIQEVGVSGSGSTSGNYKGIVGFYNYFNINAISSADPVLKGLEYAKGTDAATGRPWNTPYKAIVNGAAFVAKNYIKREPAQDTIYFQKFDVKSGGFWHQYMTNIQACESESRRLARVYENIEMMDAPLVFQIPVYEDMPDTAAPMPAESGNPNNWLSSLQIEGYSLTPTFDPTVTEGYDLIVPGSVSSVNVLAATVAQTSTVSGVGVAELAPGLNTVSVTVTAQNGTQRMYSVDVVRQAVDSEFFSSTMFRVEGESYIRGIQPGISGKMFFENIVAKEGYSLRLAGADGEEFADMTAFIGTGTVLEVLNSSGDVASSFTVLLMGDANGDGRTTSTDLTLLRWHTIEKQMLESHYWLASDVNGDERVTSTDLTLICWDVLGKQALIQ